jgi:hypothetical protein
MPNRFKKESCLLGKPRCPGKIWPIKKPRKNSIGIILV